MTRADDIRWLAERISPDHKGWAWPCWSPNPMPLDEPQWTLDLREWASTRPWWKKTLPGSRLLNVAVSVGLLLVGIVDAQACAKEVYFAVLAAERAWAEKEAKP